MSCHYYEKVQTLIILYLLLLLTPLSLRTRTSFSFSSQTSPWALWAVARASMDITSNDNDNQFFICKKSHSKYRVEKFYVSIAKTFFSLMKTERCFTEWLAKYKTDCLNVKEEKTNEDDKCIHRCKSVTCVLKNVAHLVRQIALPLMVGSLMACTNWLINGQTPKIFSSTQLKKQSFYFQSLF